ncbi:hypothetical protein GCM10023080_003710 [Streptomyces pseudoechinosporeus]
MEGWEAVVSDAAAVVAARRARLDRRMGRTVALRWVRFEAAGVWLVAQFPAPLRSGGWVGAVGRCVSPSQAGRTALAWYRVLVLRDRT